MIFIKCLPTCVNIFIILLNSRSTSYHQITYLLIDIFRRIYYLHFVAFDTTFKKRLLHKKLKMSRRHTAPSTRRNATGALTLVSTSSCIRHCTSHHTHNVAPSLKCRQIISAKQLLKVAAHYSTTTTYRLVTKM